MNSIVDFIKDIAIGILVDYVKQILLLAIAAGCGGFIIIRVNPKWERRAQKLRNTVLSFIWRKRASLLLLLLLLTVISFFLWSRSITPSMSGKTLKTIQNRGELRCGVNINLLGLGATVENSLEDNDTSALAKVIRGDLEHYDLSPSKVEGLDVDFCRAVAAAIFGAEASDSKWKAIYFEDSKRLDAVKQGLVDVSFRNTSWTSKRDLLDGVDFGPPNFYDQLTILIRNKSSELDSSGGASELLPGRRICVAKGTTSYSNMEKLRTEQRKNNVNFELITTRGNPPVDIVQTEQAFTAFLLKECDAVASDRSQIVSRLFAQERESDEEYLMYGDNSSEATSVELFSPVIAEGDDAWKKLISQVIFTTIYAEEIGVSQKDVKNSNTDGFKIESFLRPDDEDNYWKLLEIRNNQFPARSIIQSVGNYREIFDRNLGKIYEEHFNSINRKNVSSSEIYIQELRGPNRLLKNGGVLVSPPT